MTFSANIIPNIDSEDEVLPDSFLSLIDESATQYPHRRYLIDPEANLSMTYSELRTNCRRFGRQLQMHGIAADSNVGFLLDNGFWTAVITLGTMYSGRVTVPLNPIASKQNLQYVVDKSEIEIVFVSSTHRSLLKNALSAVRRTIQVFEVDMLKGIEWTYDNASHSNFGPKKIHPGSSAMILYTSGTTGYPKGAVLTHKNLIAGARNVQVAHDLTREDVAYCVLPLFHINGLVVTAVAPIVSGSRVVMARRFSVRKFWGHVKRFGCTWTSIVPTIAKFLLEAAHQKETDFEAGNIQKMRFARSASSAMPAGMHIDFEETFQMPMIETMGLTETAAPILSNPMPPGIRKSGSVGIAVGDEVMVVNQDEQQLPPGDVGEIVVRGDNVISKYYNAPEATASSFTGEGWFKTGDLGYQDEDGYFFVTGRIKELIIKGGENISPREIDDVLYHHSSVLEVASFGFPDQYYGETVAVAVVLKLNQRCSSTELIDHCKSELGDFRSPSRVFFVNSLPKGPSGKIQRLEIARKLRARSSHCE